MIMERFVKGKVSINCESESDAINLFRWMVNKGLTWNTGPLTSTSWDEYKEDTIYQTDYNGALRFWYKKGRPVGTEETIRFKDIPQEELILIELNLPDNISFEELSNQYAIHCKTKEENITLFKFLGIHKVKHSSALSICSEYNVSWDYFFKENTTYTVANKKSTHQMHIDTAKALGYKVISLENLSM